MGKDLACNQQKAVATLISQKADFSAKKMIENKNGHYILIKEDQPTRKTKQSQTCRHQTTESQNRGRKSNYS